MRGSGFGLFRVPMIFVSLHLDADLAPRPSARTPIDVSPRLAKNAVPSGPVSTAGASVTHDFTGARANAANRAPPEFPCIHAAAECTRTALPSPLEPPRLT